MNIASCLIVIFIGYFIGFICGGRMAIDSCSKDIENSVIIKHIKECIFDEKISNENKILIIKGELNDK